MEAWVLAKDILPLCWGSPYNLDTIEVDLKAEESEPQ